MSNDAPPVDYKTMLLSEREHLVAQLGELGFGDGGGLDYDPNFADSSQVTAERGEAEALASPLRDALQEVDRALEKLAKGTYGRCEECNEEISPARLEAMPSTRYCISCASSR